MLDIKNIRLRRKQLYIRMNEGEWLRVRRFMDSQPIPPDQSTACRYLISLALDAIDATDHVDHKNSASK